MQRNARPLDECVKALADKHIPAYGRYISAPLPEAVYQDIPVGTGKVTVERTTGKPYGPGSNESVLLPEFLPPT